jgi:hypothetical protein
MTDVIMSTYEQLHRSVMMCAHFAGPVHGGAAAGHGPGALPHGEDLLAD